MITKILGGAVAVLLLGVIAMGAQLKSAVAENGTLSAEVDRLGDEIETLAGRLAAEQERQERNAQAVADAVAERERLRTEAEILKRRLRDAGKGDACIDVAVPADVLNLLHSLDPDGDGGGGSVPDTPGPDRTDPAPVALARERHLA